MATAALKSIRVSFPEDTICAIVRPAHSELLEESSLCDELITADETGYNVFSEGIRMRDLKFDTAVVLPRSFRAALLMRLSGAPRRLGFAAGGRSSLLTDLVEYQPRVNTRDMYLRLCKALGCRNISDELTLSVSKRHEIRAREILSPLCDHPVIGIVPGGSYGSAKLWPVEHFVKTMMIITKETGAKFVVLHGPEEGEIARQIGEAAEAVLVSEGLGLLKSIVRRLDLLLTNDTGPRHIGAAFGVPTVVLMGPSKTEYTDYPAEKIAILREEVECGPCQLKICPENHECMRNLSPERAAEECLKMLGSVRRENQ